LDFFVLALFWRVSNSPVQEIFGGHLWDLKPSGGGKPVAILKGAAKILY